MSRRFQERERSSRAGAGAGGTRTEVGEHWARTRVFSMITPGGRANDLAFRQADMRFLGLIAQ